jgi:hypothetical protein
MKQFVFVSIVLILVFFGLRSPRTTPCRGFASCEQQPLR